MIKEFKKDHVIGSFLDSLYIEKGLSKNTVDSYENDIKAFSKWTTKTLGLHIKNLNKIDINSYIAFLFKEGLKKFISKQKNINLKSVLFIS